jgi:hypothetical protein
MPFPATFLSESHRQVPLIYLCISNSVLLKNRSRTLQSCLPLHIFSVLLSVSRRLKTNVQALLC